MAKRKQPAKHTRQPRKRKRRVRRGLPLPPVSMADITRMALVSLMAGFVADLFKSQMPASLGPLVSGEIDAEYIDDNDDILDAEILTIEGEQ